MKRNKEKRLGQLLLDKKLITEKELQKALDIQAYSGGMLGEILISEGFIRAIDFYRVLSEKLNMEFVTDDFYYYKEMVNEKLARHFEKETLMQKLFFPLKTKDNTLTLMVVRQEDKEVEELIEEKMGFVELKKIIATKRDIQNMVENTFKKEMIRESISDMYSRNPEESAARVFTLPQIVFFALLSVLTIFGALYYPYQTAVYIFYIINFMFLASILFKFLLSIVGSFYEKDEFISKAEVADIIERELPIYSVLVPVYKELEVIEQLINNLKKLDYPKSKLEVLFLFEENDLETINKAKSVQTPDNWSFIYIPDSQPKTKPKALNYGVKEARGEYVTIYDAEDKPEPDQLKKAVAAFKKSDDNIDLFSSSSKLLQ
ncbi:MAG: glycosyltransferase [Halanaerobiales bacterium]|nr:glycosyltransferase [Halanaerobiales bacterium]